MARPVKNPCEITLTAQGGVKKLLVKKGDELTFSKNPRSTDYFLLVKSTENGIELFIKPEFS